MINVQITERKNIAHLNRLFDFVSFRKEDNTLHEVSIETKSFDFFKNRCMCARGVCIIKKSYIEIDTYSLL